ncbi:hypothetical protein QL285_039967 [Trifolium repens]|nr:hypothetical protein QL285_039967 [Trifolium repens]
MLISTVNIHKIKLENQIAKPKQFQILNIHKFHERIRMQMSIEHENFTNLQQSKFNFDLRSIGMESERTECNFNLHRKQLELELESESKLESIVEMKMEMLESESESKGIAISEINRNRSFAISEMNWNQSS